VFTARLAFTSDNALRGILFVARKYGNESYKSSFIELSVDNSEEQVDQYVTKVKMPFYFKVTIRENISQDKDGTPHYTTYDIIRKKPFYGDLKEESIDNIVEIKRVEIVFTNTCPQCGKEGRPRIDKKNTTHYNYPKYDDNTKEIYHLIYNHKQEDKTVTKCVIANFDKAHGIFTENDWLSKRAHDCIFPNYLI
jgi:disulfide oxidoreductase YuzD